MDKAFDDAETLLDTVALNGSGLVGETSRHVPRLVGCRLDGDTALLLVEQTRPTCHAGARSCLFQPVPVGGAYR